MYNLFLKSEYCVPKIQFKWTSKMYSMTKCSRMNQHHFCGRGGGGERGSRRHSSTSLSANVVVAKTRYQMLEVLSFCGLESA